MRGGGTEWGGGIHALLSIPVFPAGIGARSSPSKTGSTAARIGISPRFGGLVLGAAARAGGQAVGVVGSGAGGVGEPRPEGGGAGGAAFRRLCRRVPGSGSARTGAGRCGPGCSGLSVLSTSSRGTADGRFLFGPLRCHNGGDLSVN
jgi:hypothetical protein